MIVPSRNILCYNQHKNAQGEGMAVRLKVREIAEQQGYNISTLSRKADVGLSTIRRLWHDPYRHVDFDVLERLGKALEVPVTALIEDVADQP
jgi:DNA-binding Xre family transcriptional regulator